MNKITPVLALAVSMTGLALINPAQAATTHAAAFADSHVDARYATRNYATSTKLHVDGTTDRKKHAFLKFTVPTIAAGEELERVTLRLRPFESSTHGVRVYLTGNGWSESTLTWRSMPTQRTLLGSSNALHADTTEVVRLDPSLVTPGQVLAVRVETSAQKALSFASTEARTTTTRPALGVTVSTPTPTPTPTTFPPAGSITTKQVGMSAHSNLWDARIAEVGAQGVTARRIFADLSSTGSSQMPLIREAIADGMIPVISYKVPSPATLAQGGYDAWLVTLRTQLNGLDAPVTATFWHEPHGDMDPAVFRAASLRFFNVVDSPDIAVGPILNGWLLDRRVADFASYTDPTLLTKWEFVGVDSYQEGTATEPNSTLLPARAVPKLAAWLDGQGHPDKKIVLGEYNGFTGSAIAQAGEFVLSTPELWIACVWNVDHTTFSVLTGDRLTAYQQTKSDPRAVR